MFGASVKLLACFTSPLQLPTRICVVSLCCLTLRAPYQMHPGLLCEKCFFPGNELTALIPTLNSDCGHAEWSLGLYPETHLWQNLQKKFKDNKRCNTRERTYSFHMTVNRFTQQHSYRLGDDGS